MSLKEIFKLVLSWRLVLVLVSIFSMFLVSPRLNGNVLTQTPSVENAFSVWSNFDGLQYLKIAEYGYGYQHKTTTDYVFFPVFPWVVRTFNFFGSYLASGLIWSHVFLILSLYFLYKLISLDHKSKTAKSAIFLLLIFPTAFFFGSVYNESLFLLLTVLSFWFVRKKNLFMACIFASFASATRITGIFIWPALIYEFWVTSGKDIKKFINVNTVWLLLPPLGLFSFIRFQALKVGDPLFFIRVQSTFEGRSPEKLILIYQVFFRYTKMVLFMNHSDPLFYTVLLELLTALLVIFVLIFSFKKVRFSYWVFMLLSYLLPTFTGTFTSMPRFTIVLFPVFIYLSLWFENHHPYLRIAYYLICTILTIFGVAFFTNGFFVA